MSLSCYCTFAWVMESCFIHSYLQELSSLANLPSTTTTTQDDPTMFSKIRAALLEHLRQVWDITKPHEEHIWFDKMKSVRTQCIRGRGLCCWYQLGPHPAIPKDRSISACLSLNRHTLPGFPKPFLDLLGSTSKLSSLVELVSALHL